jgi:cytosine/adenosine deaminase-related metal-dependent hydrolase
LRCRSADHLIFVDRSRRRRARAAGTVATLLPIAAFYLKLGRLAPARMLIDRGVAVALATDVNPGGGFSPSMPFAMTLACFGMGLTSKRRSSPRRSTPRRRSIATTASAASNRASRWTPCIVGGPAIDLIRVGADVIRAVVKRGTVVYGT